MDETLTIQLFPAIPEIFLACMTLLMLIVGVFRGNEHTAFLAKAAILIIVLTIALLARIWDDSYAALNGLFITDNFAVFVKILLLVAASFVLLISLEYMRKKKTARMEYPVLIMLSLIGMMVMVSANDLLSLYMGLELQSLSLYIMASINRDSKRSSEAGLKYFVLGALSSGLLLYGCSLIYGFTGTTSFDSLTQLFLVNSGEAISKGVILGLVLVMIGLCFKISAVPFHMWTPDVYEGAPTPVTAFFAAAPKIAAMALFIRLLMQPFSGLSVEWQQIIIFVSAASMILGSFAAIRQSNIKRLMAYSSIGHMGYILIGMASGTVDGIHASLVYLSIYAFMSIGAFACILHMRQDGEGVEDIKSLAGVSHKQPVFAFALAIFMFSMAGIPPLAGFFGKFFVLKAALDSDLYILAVIGVLTSVVAAYYYLRVIKVMYFDDEDVALDSEMSRESRMVLLAMAAFNLLFFVFPTPLLDVSRAAIMTLFS